MKYKLVLSIILGLGSMFITNAAERVVVCEMAYSEG
jgi:hypothetical protein